MHWGHVFGTHFRVVHNEFSGVQTLLLRKSGSIAACFAANYISGAASVSKRCSLRFCEGPFLSLPPWRGKRNRLTQWRYCNVSMTQWLTKIPWTWKPWKLAWQRWKLRWPLWKIRWLRWLKWLRWPWGQTEAPKMNPTLGHQSSSTPMLTRTTRWPLLTYWLNQISECSPSRWVVMVGHSNGQVWWVSCGWPSILDSLTFPWHSLFGTTRTHNWISTNPMDCLIPLCWRVRATSSVSLLVYLSTSDHPVGCTLVGCWRRPFGRVPGRWTSLHWDLWPIWPISCRIRPDFSIWRWIGSTTQEALWFRDPAPQLTKSGLTPLQTPLSPETHQIQNGTSSVIQLQPIRSCPLGFTSTYTDGMQFYENDTDFIPASCDADRAAVVTKMVLTLPTADGEEPSDLRYWDESAMVLFVQMIRNGGKAQAAVCTEWEKKRFAVMLEAGNNASVSGGQYSRLLENEFGQEAVQCMTGNLTEFKIAYFEGFCSR